MPRCGVLWPLGGQPRGWPGRGRHAARPQVRFSRPESEQARQRRVQSYEFLQKKHAEEPWVHLHYHGRRVRGRGRGDGGAGGRVACGPLSHLPSSAAIVAALAQGEGIHPMQSPPLLWSLYPGGRPGCHPVPVQPLSSERLLLASTSAMHMGPGPWAAHLRSWPKSLYDLLCPFSPSGALALDPALEIVWRIGELVFGTERGAE